jgi:protein tyrosine/serine phosphatase
LKALFQGKTEEVIEKDPGLKNLALEAKFRTTSNMNGARFRFPSGVERTVFRGSYLAPLFTKTSVTRRRESDRTDPRAECMRSLVRDHGLSKIVNYDELDWPSAKNLTEEERDSLLRYNPKAGYWKFNDAVGRTFQYKISKVPGADDQARKRFIFDDLARIIREIEGKKSDPGAVYIHCYGGHHRTGAVYGVLQKCIGGMPVDRIIEEYRCHIGYESEERRGGHHPDNETVIREFPCRDYFT